MAGVPKIPLGDTGSDAMPPVGDGRPIEKDPRALPDGPAYRHAYKQVWLAYVLLLIGSGGGLALHRFYLGYTRSGGIMLGLFLLSVFLPMFSGTEARWLSLPLLAWVIVDLFLIPSLARRRNAQIAEEISGSL